MPVDPSLIGTAVSAGMEIGGIVGDYWEYQNKKAETQYQVYRNEKVSGIQEELAGLNAKNDIAHADRLDANTDKKTELGIMLLKARNEHKVAGGKNAAMNAMVKQYAILKTASQMNDTATDRYFRASYPNGLPAAE